MAITILIADDDSAIRTVLNQALGRAGYDVRTTGTAAGLWRWVAAGEVRYREDIREGLEALPAAFAEMLKGGNFGKMLVRVGDDPTL